MWLLIFHSCIDLIRELNVEETTVVALVKSLTIHPSTNFHLKDEPLCDSYRKNSPINSINVKIKKFCITVSILFFGRLLLQWGKDGSLVVLVSNN